MELWIRSQEKDRLIKCQSLDILDRNQSPIVQDNLKTRELNVMIIGNDNVNLGTYPKERALEILDEIQNLLKPQIKLITHAIEQRELKDFSREMIIQPPINELQFQEANTWVYQMPEE